jgi:molybdopterin-synthase adenylyltransferase
MMEARGRMALREDQIRRYARHVLLPDVGGRGQERLLAAAVAVELRQDGAAEVAALAYLAAAGVGRLVLTGDVSGPLGEGEIAAGILYAAADRGRPRGRAAAERIAALNPDVTVIAAGTAPPPADAVRLADDLEPAPADAGEAALADALARGGAAASRLLARIARRS